MHNPAKRLSIAQILQHGWMQKGGAEAVINRESSQGSGPQYCELVLGQLGVSLYSLAVFFVAFFVDIRATLGTFCVVHRMKPRSISYDFVSPCATYYSLSCSALTIISAWHQLHMASARLTVFQLAYLFITDRHAF